MTVDLRLLSDKLRRYREQFTLSPEDVSRATGIPLHSVLDFERGISAPSGDELLILSDFYKCDYKFFLSNERLAPFEQTETLFRRYSHTLSRDDRWAIQEFLFLAECEAFLLQQLDKPHPKPFTFVKRGRFYKAHGRDAAASLRALLGYSENEIPRDVYKDFRAIGLHVFRRKLQNTTVSGISVKHPIAGKCILINYSEDVYRQRFTAAHEAAHSILDDREEVHISFQSDKADLSEVRANTFASSYLLPPAFLRKLPDPSEWTEAKARHWAKELMVSTEALAIALKEAELVSQDAFSLIKSTKVPLSDKLDPELPESLSPAQRSRREALLRRGLSTYYVGLSFEAYHKDVITAARLAEILLLEDETELREVARAYGEALVYAD